MNELSAPDPWSAKTRIGILEYGYWLFLVVAIGRVGELLGLTAIPLGKLALALPILMRIAKRKRLPHLIPAVKSMTRASAWLIAFAVLATPFSIWPGNSWGFIYQELPVLIATVAIAWVMSRSWRSLRGTFLALVISGLLLARSAITGYGGGRASTDTMYDPNDLAYLLVTVLPLALGFFVTARGALLRVVYAGICLVLVAALLLTQSRGGLLGLVAVALAMTFIPLRPPARDAHGVPLKPRSRIPLLLGMVLVSILIWTQLPEDARQRFATLLDLGNDYNLDPNDISARGQIWHRAIEATLAWPFGWGPESFKMVDLKFGGVFFAPHNSYLEVTVELGVLALFVFIRMYFLALRALQRVRTHLLQLPVISRPQTELLLFARLLQFSLIGNTVAGFFLSMSYAIVLWTLFGLVMAVVLLAAQTPQDVATELSRSNALQTPDAAA